MARVDRRDSKDSTTTRDKGQGHTPTTKKPHCRDYDEKDFCLRGNLCKFDHGTDAMVPEDAGRCVTYTPDQPYVTRMPALGMTVPPPGYAPGPITVPPPGYAPPQYGKRPYEGGMHGAPEAKRFDYHRLKGSRPGGAQGGSMLAIGNLAPEFNMITHLNGISLDLAT